MTQKEGPPLPPRATGIVLGIWIAALLLIAFVIVPMLFAVCVPPAPTSGLGP